ncbi:4-hydroxy-tetrahydrodipicolinate reductase [Paracidobacterium acidisoli]|uniref:4-hydroxy-tetrahydrodipicolinate reductase n=1 Tax=Paracidobacterium acidisoli TaxID=2303751 RepID=A0A372IQA6_9BACT|nr:4-hydroxy-tetrahydrodipicolinate reductase [Paracidobacterium acidisoli]MBT9331430.1 4-hydroxy-tetrahydrodipicolinate reductase [Paracidobacterium acidisoli]
MLILVLGRGKTGSLVTQVAREHGHSVRVVGEEENRDAMALTAPFLAQFDAVIDFTTPEAVVRNLRACLANGARVVVGTTGWYQHLDDMRQLATRRSAALLYGTNFSIGVQALFRVARELALAAPHYSFRITETHHADKKDAPSGTALTLKQVLQTANPAIDVEIVSKREGDASGIHLIEARSENDAIELKHEAFSRRGFAEGAVRAAEWIAGKNGCWDFQEVVGQLG